MSKKTSNKPALHTKESAPEFEVVSGKDLVERRGRTAAPRPVIRLDESRIPKALWHLIADAERLGVADDFIREDVWEQLSVEEREVISARVRAAYRELGAWLAGPEADAKEKSPEYLAFSFLRMTI